MSDSSNTNFLLLWGDIHFFPVLHVTIRPRYLIGQILYQIVCHLRLIVCVSVSG